MSYYVSDCVNSYSDPSGGEPTREEACAQCQSTCHAFSGSTIDDLYDAQACAPPSDGSAPKTCPAPGNPLPRPVIPPSNRRGKTSSAPVPLTPVVIPSHTKHPKHGKKTDSTQTFQEFVQSHQTLVITATVFIILLLILLGVLVYRKL